MINVQYIFSETDTIMHIDNLIEIIWSQTFFVHGMFGVCIKQLTNCQGVYAT